MHGSLKFLASHFHLLLFINPSRPSFFPSFAACYLDTVTCSAGSHAFYGHQPHFHGQKNLDTIRRFALTILWHRVVSELKSVSFICCLTFYIICEIWHFPSVTSGVWKCILVDTYVLEQYSVQSTGQNCPLLPRRERWHVRPKRWTYIPNYKM
jgi:hypothetical protein